MGSEAKTSSAMLRPCQARPANTLSMPSPVISGNAGTTSRLASGEISEVRPNCARATGAVPTPAATDTATFAPNAGGSRLSSLCNGGTRAIMPTNAENDS